MQYKGWTICSFGSHCCIAPEGDPDYYQFPLSSVEDAKRLIDMPPLAREIQILVLEMSCNSEAGHNLREIAQLLESEEIPEDFLRHFGPAGRKVIISAYVADLGRRLAQES